jgi:ssDNA-binding replication factor A large subunit
MVVNALIGDETGTIKLCLWEGQINTVALGDSIEIKMHRFAFLEAKNS